MQIHHIAGYKFVSLQDIETLRGDFLERCQQLKLKGTILLSAEGININLSGETESIQTFISYLTCNPHFADMTFRHTHTDTQPYQRMKIKLKKEIITLRQPNVEPGKTRAPSISPDTFKKWLDEKRDITVLDTRNDYEIEMGAFENAVNLQLTNFCEFASSLNDIPRDKPIVMYCTGGIRCEKAAVHLMNEGYNDVYQLDGGILHYFEKVGHAHYQGECYVFDERESLKSDRLAPTITKN
jgi:UPF0176 protein